MSILPTSDTGSTPLYGACDKSRNLDVIKFLVSQGADIDKPNNGNGMTCLMLAVIRSAEICQFLVDQGADLNKKDFYGKTALHIACNNSHIHAVRLLVKHGADPSIKNNEGDDVFQKASLQGQHEILDEFVSSVNPPISHQIEYYQLLGAYHVDRGQIQTAMSHWRTAVQIRESNPCDDVKAFEPNPVYLFVQEVNIMEELERLGQNHDKIMVQMYALMVRERILGPGHKETIKGLLNRSVNVNLRQGIGLQMYAFQLRRSCLDQFIKEYRMTLTVMCSWMWNEARTEYFKEVLDLFEMVTSMFGIPLIESRLFQTYQERILDIMRIITKMKKDPEQTLAFRKVVHRLIKIGNKAQNGETFLHCEVGRTELQPCHIAVVVRVWSQRECGRHSGNNTALHLCTQALPYLEGDRQDNMNEVILILLEHSAHVDMVNNAGKIASEGLKLNLLNYVSLKCLASTAIMKHRVSYVGYISDSLRSFVEMHVQHGAFKSESIERI